MVKLRWVLSLVVLASAIGTADALDYTVRRGDTLARIASRHNVTLGELKAANGLAPGAAGDLIHPGQILVIPEFEEDNGLPTPTQPYTVIGGDTLSKLAIRFRTDVSTIKRLNGLAPGRAGDVIHVGQILKLPGIRGSSSTGAVRDQPEVIRHAAITATDEEIEVLARIVKGEMPETGPWEGKVAVAAVVLNRVRSSKFPITIKGVAHQRAQFSSYNSNVRNRLYWGRIPDYAWAAARAALAGEDPTLGATYYFNPYLVLPSWARNLDFVKRIGFSRTTTHDFYMPRADRVVAASSTRGSTTRTAGMSSALGR